MKTRYEEHGITIGQDNILIRIEDGKPTAVAFTAGKGDTIQALNLPADLVLRLAAALRANGAPEEVCADHGASKHVKGNCLPCLAADGKRICQVCEGATGKMEAGINKGGWSSCGACAGSGIQTFGLASVSA